MATSAPPHDPAHMGLFDPANVEAERAALAAAKRPLAGEAETAKMRAATNAKAEQRKAEKQQAKLAPPSAARAPPAQPPDDPHYKATLLKRVAGYRQLNGALKPRHAKWCIVQSSQQEIEQEVRHLEDELGKGDTRSLGTHLLLTFMSGVETLTREVYNPLNLQLSGLADITRSKSAELAPLIEELMIKYDASLSVAVEWRLAMVLTQTVVLVHMANTGNLPLEKVLAASQRPIVPPNGAADL